MFVIMMSFLVFVITKMFGDWFRWWWVDQYWEWSFILIVELEGFRNWYFLTCQRERKMTIQNGSKAFVIVWALRKYLWVNISLFYEATVIIFPMLVSKISIRRTDLPILGQVNHVLTAGTKWRLLVLSIPDLKYHFVERSLWKLAFLWVLRVNTIKNEEVIGGIVSFSCLMRQGWPYKWNFKWPLGRFGKIFSKSLFFIALHECIIYVPLSSFIVFSKSLAKFWAGENTQCFMRYVPKSVTYLGKIQEGFLIPKYLPHHILDPQLETEF